MVFDIFYVFDPALTRQRSSSRDHPPQSLRVAVRQRFRSLKPGGNVIVETEVAIIGAGPYGLSLAAHLRSAGADFRVIGHPMEAWRNHMPEGMLLKSDGFACYLYDPQGEYPLSRHCRELGIAYDDKRTRVRLNTS